jgi:GntR family transcriptional regulator, galactonate operon transcriptional repressor
MRKTSHRDAVEVIAGWIVGGAQQPGSALPTEPDICQRLGLSRTVVREAVKTLVAKGLLQAGPRVGTRVLPQRQWNVFDPDVIRWRLAAGVDADFVRDVIDVRLAIEPTAAALAAARADDADIARMDEALAAMAASVEGYGGWLDGDLAFHRSVLFAAHNQFFSGMMPLIEAILSVSFRQSVKSRDSARNSLPLHKAARDAIVRHDGEGAANAFRALILSARRDIETDLAIDGFVSGAGRQEQPARRSAA